MFNVGRGFALVINFCTLTYSIRVAVLYTFVYDVMTETFQDFLFPSLLMKTPMLGL